MNNMKHLFILFSFLCLLFSNAEGQVICGECGSEYMLTNKADTVFVHDTVKVYISGLDDITGSFGITFDEFVKTFLIQKEKIDSTGGLSSQTVYLNYLMPMWRTQGDFSDKRIISDIFTLCEDKNFLTDSMQLSDSVEVKNRDIVFMCGNGVITDYFLTSASLVDSALVGLFRYIYRLNGNVPETEQVRGINFFFPGFLFREKRAMTQFAKSVSLIIDSTNIETIRGMSLYYYP